MRTFVFLFALICVLPFGHLRADSIVTPERSALRHATISMSVFKSMNDGRLPTSWNELASVYDVEKDGAGMRVRQGYQLDEQYQFLDQEVVVPGAGGGRILLIRTTPLEASNKTEKELYRYLVCEADSGEIIDTRASEEKIQAAFKAAGVALPRIGNLPAIETEYSQTAPAPGEARPPSSSQLPSTATPTRNTLPPSTPRQAPPASPHEAAHAETPSPSFPAFPMAILAALILAAIAFFLIRRKP